MTLCLDNRIESFSNVRSSAEMSPNSVYYFTAVIILNLWF